MDKNMALLVNKLIQQSFKLAGLYQHDRFIDGSRINETLDILNELLDSNSADPTYIAFWRVLQFPVTAGKREYTFSRAIGADVDSDRIVQLKHSVLISQSTRYPVEIIDDYDYYSVTYTESTAGRPSALYLQNDVGESTLIYTSSPDQSYTGEIKAKFVLQNISLNQDITDVPAYYIRYLKFALAQELTFEYMPENWTASHQRKLEQLENNLRAMTDVNVSTRLSPALLGRRNWYYNNIGVNT